jgi:hypothetical protein
MREIVATELPFSQSSGEKLSKPCYYTVLSDIENTSFERLNCWVVVPHTYNPSYSGGRDQNHSLKPAWANSLQDPISKKPNTKRG